MKYKIQYESWKRKTEADQHILDVKDFSQGQSNKNKCHNI